MFNTENVLKNLNNIVNQINDINKEIIKKHPFDIYIDCIEKEKNECGYNIKSSLIIKTCEDIIKENGVTTLKLYHKAILITLLLKNHTKTKEICILKDIISITHKNFENIFDVVLNNKEELLYSNDKFCKNIAISSLRLIPLGAQKINISRIALSMFYKGGLNQFFKVIYLICFTLRGIKPLYEIHTDSGDPNLLKEFNAEGWEKMYKRLAEFLKIYKHVKGVIGTSWFFDPVISEISPRLTYLREMVTNNGGLLFYMGVDEGNDAIFKSKTRRELYKSGKYIPKKYTLIWPRKEIIEWNDN